MKQILQTLFFVCLFASTCFGQSDTAFVGRLISNLKNYSAGHLREKAYLQFDKPYYATGDTIYFKAYVTVGEEHKLSNISGVLHVDLIDPANKILSNLRVQLINGLAAGDFALADSLPPGDYKVRAYTQYIQKEDHFYQHFAIGSIKKNAISESVTSTQKNSSADLQFFPEGGNLVTDIRSRVVFKAVGTDGLGTNVKGIVVDNYNNMVASFESGFAGMGSFMILPEHGRSYRVKYKFKDSVQHIVALPAVQNKGIILTASTADSDNLKIAVLANPAYYKENKNKFFLVSIYAGGKFTYVRNRLESYELDLTLPVSKFQSGVARVTLFDETGSPLSERLVFIKNPAMDVAPTVSVNKIVYNQRDNVKVDLTNANISPDRSGHYSVSVVNESKMPGATYANSLYAYLLLTSELKGFIESPDYYFDNNSDKARAALNVLMLTQGYRKFTWKQLADGLPADAEKKPERSLSVSGIVKTLNDKKPISNGTVNIIVPNGGPLLTTQTDSLGRFNFSGLLVNDTTGLIITAVNSKGKNGTLINIDRSVVQEPVPLIPGDLNPPVDMQAYLQNSQLQKLANSTYNPPKGKLLKEVKIKALRSSNLAGSGHYDQAVDFRNMPQGGPLVEILRSRLHGINFRNGYAFLIGFHTGAMNVVLDGNYIEERPDSTGSGLSTLLTIDPNTIETVEVLKYANASIYGVSAGNGVLVITTKQGHNADYEIPSPTGILPFKPNGFYVAREFYTPKYLPGFASAKPDLRSTIYWQPNLNTDENGKASFNYYNADGTGNYRITVEGIDNNGNLAHAVYRYAVK